MPPLYKVTQKKRETYLKDDDHLHEYLLARALDEAVLQGSDDREMLESATLKQLFDEYHALERILQRLARRYDEKILKELILLHNSDLSPIENPTEFGTRLERRLNQRQEEGTVYRVHAETDPEQKGILVERTRHGLKVQTRLGPGFFESPEYRSMASLGETLERIVGSRITVRRGDRSAEVESFEEARDWLLGEARRGVSLQRYKGLGEMNPEQLWETTMDMENRRLLKVAIEDGFAADDTFTDTDGRPGGAAAGIHREKRLRGNQSRRVAWKLSPGLTERTQT